MDVKSKLFEALAQVEGARFPLHCLLNTEFRESERKLIDLLDQRLCEAYEFLKEFEKEYEDGLAQTKRKTTTSPKKRAR